jgi:putative spermidine/putrescine transport system permease protein
MVDTLVADGSARRTSVAKAMQKEEGWLNILLLAPATILMVAVFLLPLSLVLKNSVFTPEGLSGFYFVKFLTDPYYLGVLWRTLRLGLIGTVVVLAPGYVLAYNLVYHPSRRFRMLVLAVTVVPLVVNLVVRLFGWIAIFSQEGTIHEVLSLIGYGDVSVRLLFTESAIIVGLVHSHVTFMVLPIAGALSKIDLSLLRAAQNLGASPWRGFFNVTLPLSVPGVMAGCLICFALNISDFIAPVLLGGERIRMMTYLIYEQQLHLANDYFAAAETVILLTVSSLSILVGVWLANRFNRRFYT